jgi:hypothetical protein
MPKRPGYYREYEAAHIKWPPVFGQGCGGGGREAGPALSAEEEGETTEAGPRCSRRPSNNPGSPGLTPSEGAEDLTPEIAGGEADHVTIWRYFTRIGRGYIERAIRLLFELI